LPSREPHLAVNAVGHSAGILSDARWLGGDIDCQKEGKDGECDFCFHNGSDLEIIKS
jgi:hypothetical protein